MIRAHPHRKTVLLVGAVIFFMLALTYASPPLYRLFCQVTGYGGTPKISRADLLPTSQNDAPGQTRLMRARLIGDVEADLPWDFAPQQTLQDIPIGEQVRLTFVARNRSDQPSSGTATYNVIPATAAPYIHKIECFCFTEQTLAGRQEVVMPFVVYIDPAIAENPATRSIKTVTFTYRFFSNDL